MSSVVFDQVRAAFDALAAHADEPTAVWTTRQRREQLTRVETLARMLPALAHELINQLAADATGEELGGSLSHALANWLRITRHEAARRIHEAEDLGPRRALTGQPLAPRLEATAAAQQRGSIGGEHVQVIRGFFAHLPSWIDEPTRADERPHEQAIEPTNVWPGRRRWPRGHSEGGRTIHAPLVHRTSSPTPGMPPG